MDKKKILFWIFLAIVLLSAGFLRVWQIDSTPPGLYPDEAMNGVNALEAIDSGNYKVFYPENNGREGLFINIQALSIKLLGNTPFALRIISVIFGTLTIPGVFLLSWFLLKKDGPENKSAMRIAFLSSLLMASSFWHINFSRIGFRAITMPFFLVYSLLFFVIGIRFWQKRNLSVFSFIVSGILLSLGLYGYTPFRLIPLLFLAAFFVFRRSMPRGLMLKRFVLLTAFSIIVFLPLGIYFVKNPQDFSNRNNKIYFFQQEEPLKELSVSVLKYAGMFNIRGDCNSRHNYDCRPQLDYFSGVLFLIGFGAIFFKKIRIIFSGKYLLFLPLGFFVSLLPGALTTEGGPHALRTMGTTPFVFIYAALGAELLFLVVGKITSGLKRNIFFVFLFLIIIFALFIGPYNYFVKWPEANPDFSQNYLAEAYFLKEFSGAKKVIIVNASTGVRERGLPTTAMTSKYILWQEFKDNHLSYVFSPDFKIVKTEGQQIIITSLEPDESIFADFKKRFPQGEIIEEKTSVGSFQAFLLK